MYAWLTRPPFLLVGIPKPIYTHNAPIIIQLTFSTPEGDIVQGPIQLATQHHLSLQTTAAAADSRASRAR